MMRCWAGNPSERPKFAEIVRQLGFMLDDESVSQKQFICSQINYVVSIRLIKC